MSISCTPIDMTSKLDDALKLDATLDEREVKGKNNTRKWAVKTSTYGGRALFAVENIAAGEMIFMDLPIVSGPRLSDDLIGCVVCGNCRAALKNCSKNCRLPVCSEKCDKSSSHKRDCDLVRSLYKGRTTEWSPLVYRSLALIRCLGMEERDRELVKMLHSNRGKQVERQVAELVTLFRGSLSHDDILWLEHCCGVLDGTAFEIELATSRYSLKGLYPLAAMMNHDCAPNTRSCYTIGSSEDGTKKYRMLVIANQAIPKGAQILTSYCPLLWGTNIRRPYLAYSKHFNCTCLRCRDETEFDTYLQAVKCECGGNMLPLNSLDMDGEWSCRCCLRKRNAKYIFLLSQSFRANLASFPDCNYIFVQLKIEKIFKSTKDNLQDITDSNLIEVVDNCVQILSLVDKLRLGNTRMKGKLCWQLGKLVLEMEMRKLPFEKSEFEEYFKCGTIMREEDEAARACFCDTKVK